MGGLEVQQISFFAGGREILADVDLAVAPGETVALLGPSGSGKTTLLRVIAGLDRAFAGRVLFDGADLTKVPAYRRGFGFMFQDHALFPHLDVAGNVAFGLRGTPPEQRRTRVAELLRLVGLSGFESRRIEKLSGGERQRVALARALAPAPRLLMLDEPLASLDRALRQRLVAELSSILDRLRIPAVYVTHDRFEAFAVADRVAILDAGHVVRTGTPPEVWAAPGTEFIARFLGMENIIDGLRDPAGMVRTPVGDFGPLPGPAGAVRIVLAAEGAAVAGRPAANVASGLLRSSAFQGSTTVVTIDSDGVEVEFELPASAALPAAGEQISVAVARAFTVD